MNKKTTILKRWIALDRDLHDGRLELRRFANQRGVDIKTIRRDLEAFKELGQRINRQPLEGGGTEWSYCHGVRPLFTANIRWKKKP